jgi:hypothetical protein
MTKILSYINLKRRKIYFDSWFLSSQAVVAWSHCLWACVEAVHHGEELIVDEMAQLLLLGSRQR